MFGLPSIHALPLIAFVPHVVDGAIADGANEAGEHVEGLGGLPRRPRLELAVDPRVVLGAPLLVFVLPRLLAGVVVAFHHPSTVRLNPSLAPSRLPVLRLVAPNSPGTGNSSSRVPYSFVAGTPRKNMSMADSDFW